MKSANSNIPNRLSSMQHSSTKISSISNPNRLSRNIINLSNLNSPVSTRMRQDTSPMRKHRQRCARLFIPPLRATHPCRIRYPYPSRPRQWDTRQSTLAPNLCLTRNFRLFRPNPTRLTCRCLTRRTLSLLCRPYRLSSPRSHTRSSTRLCRRYHTQNLFTRHRRWTHSKVDMRDR